MIEAVTRHSLVNDKTQKENLQSCEKLKNLLNLILSKH